MVGKSYLKFILVLAVVIAAQPYHVFNPFIVTCKAPDGYDYDMDNLPPQDDNGNFTIYENEHWYITGQGELEGNITLFDESKLTIVDANITINGTIWAKDSSSIEIMSSVVRVEVPSHPPIPIVNQYDNPNGFILTDDGVQFTVEDSNLLFARHDIQQNIPPGMMIPIEVFVNFGKLEIKDSYINTLGSMTTGTLRVDVYRGLVMHMVSDTHITNTTFTSGIVFYVSSQGFIENSTLTGLSIQKNTEEPIVFSNCTVTRSVTVAMVSNARFQNCEFESCLFIYNWGAAYLYNTTLAGLKVLDNGTVIMDASWFTGDPPYPDWKDFKGNSSLILMNSSSVKDVLLHDNSSLHVSGSFLNSTTLNDYSWAILKDSTIENLSAGENSTVLLQGSSVGGWPLSKNIHNITTLSITATLNDQPLQLSVELRDASNETIGSVETDKEGVAQFDFITGSFSFDENAQKITYTPLITYCNAHADYWNLHKEEDVVIDSDYEEVVLEFEDHHAPSIQNVNFEIDPFFNTNDDVPVSVHVTEEETDWTNVTLRYTTDDGETWNDIHMYNLGGNIHENSIPGQNDGTKVRFYIIAEDECKNTAESKYYAYTVGEDVMFVNRTILNTALIIILCLFVWMGIRTIMGRNKVRKYIRKTEK